MPYEIQLDSFQGPLEVLYQLVKKNRIEISEISLASIAEQYLEYMEKLKDFNLELASEFMVIAAELIELKVRTLLPRDKDKGGPEEEESNLVERLREYHYFKKISQILKEQEKKGTSFFPRAVDIYELIDKEIEIHLETELDELSAAFSKAMLVLFEVEQEQEEVEEIEWEQLKKEEIKIEEKIPFILERLNASPQGLNFADLVKNKHSKLDLVVTFLSVLELAKMARVNIRQERVFANFSVETSG
jgi:segregation and condensation protein A